MKIISWNTNGLRATHKQGHFEPLFATFKPDIVCLQETKSELDQLPEELQNFKNYHLALSPCKTKKGYSGVAIYSKEEPLSTTPGFGNKKFDDEGRIIVSEYENFFLITGYFPNGGSGPHRLEYKLEFYDAFLSYIEKLKKKKPVIFCGDVNTAHTAIDLARPKENAENTGFLPIERAWMDKLVKKGWVDIYRTLNPEQRDVYTYWDQKTRSRDRNVGWRIDYFFCSPELFPYIKSFETLTNYFGSDHCPIMIDIKIPE
ncbi:MAG: exodeoxyribonuclease III [Candidatus Pacebacteria bacterium]|nr:exodeoxyribonuclease III [Candidatus Paceibacterota bacterium]